MEEKKNPAEVTGEEIIVEKKRVNPWRIALIIVATITMLLLLALLAGIVHYGVTGSFLPRENDIFNKNSYSVSLEKLETSSGLKSFQGKMDDVIATMGEHELTNRMFQLYYWQKVNSSSFVDVNKQKPLDSQIQDPETGLTWQQYFMQEALEQWKQDMILLDAAKAAGFKMPEDMQKQFDSLEKDMQTQALSSGYASVDAMLQKAMGAGCNFEAYYQYMWDYYMGGLYLTKLVEDMEVTDAEVEKYFADNEQTLSTGYSFPVTKDSGKLVDVRHILIKVKSTGKDEDGKAITTDEDWENCRAAAQKVLDEFLAGEKTEDAFAVLATKNTEDGGSSNNGGLYEYVYPGQMVTEFNDWCFDDARQTGDTGLVKTTYGYHVMYYVYGELGWVRVCTDGAKSVKAQEMVDSWEEGKVVDVNYKAIVLAEMVKVSTK